MLKDKNSGVVVSQLDYTAKKAPKNKVREQLLAVIFVDNTNRRIYSELVKNLENDYIMSQNNYQRDMATSKKLLVNYKRMENSSGANIDGTTLVTDGRPRNHKDKSNITCF